LQVQLGGNGEVGALAQQQQQEPSEGLTVGRETPQVADATAPSLKLQLHSPHAHQELLLQQQQHQQLLQTQPSTAQHSDTIMNHALLDDVLLQVRVLLVMVMVIALRAACLPVPCTCGRAVA
jgi:hypothetical protein